jgi:hypothetical protein
VLIGIRGSGYISTCDRLRAMAIMRSGCVTSTNSAQDKSWKRWKTFLADRGMEGDGFLRGMTLEDQKVLVVVHMDGLRESGMSSGMVNQEIQYLKGNWIANFRDKEFFEVITAREGNRVKKALGNTMDEAREQVERKERNKK